MKPPGWHPALLLTLLFWPEKIQAVDVSISGTSVILTCPLGSDTNKPNKITLKHKNSIFDHKEEKPFTLQNFDESNNGLYECTVSYEGNVPPLKAKLYLKAKVCELCVEMETWTVIGILVADLLITLGVILVVYYCSKSKKGGNEGAGSHGSKPKGYSKERPPPVPNPDYEPLKKGQREVYDGLNSRGY
uniref:T-cell surface glycoprotein CD3 epsilon chain n=1 Tax=Geotrypetes seraphini TaxID=260995 RepID=A0A6P8NH23_GEOSA|nr:T-cell surface glycoprotein CD3 epsilon chain isoform X2 [Geotrypetes seraphini]